MPGLVCKHTSLVKDLLLSLASVGRLTPARPTGIYTIPVIPRIGDIDVKQILCGQSLTDSSSSSNRVACRYLRLHEITTHLSYNEVAIGTLVVENPAGAENGSDNSTIKGV